MAIVMMLALTAVFGCMSPRGGGMSEDEGFKIAVPTFTTDVKQGDRQTITVTLHRDKFFKKNVRLEISAETQKTVPVPLIAGGVAMVAGIAVVVVASRKP